jgi:ABC-2 type transport system ATP-binding protein
MLAGSPIITVDGITKRFGKRNEIEALKGVTFSVRKGEVFGLLGPNGSGKTTLIRILNCIFEPYSGTAMVNGHDLRDKNGVKRSTGLLAENPGLYERLSSREYLEFVGALYDVDKAVLRARVPKLLAMFGLDQRSDDLIEGFSKGMRQKVLIAAALVHDPPIIFLDEPTSALDPRASLVVRDLIRDLSSQAGKTVFVSSHILPIMEEVCDRMAIINEGRIVALGTVEEIVAKMGATSLEQAFLELTGGRERVDLLSWRGQVGTT